MNKIDLIKFKDKDFELDVRANPFNDTVWLTQEEISILFEKNQGVISRHINNIFKDGELDKNTSMQKMHKSLEIKHPNYRPPVYYNLDVIISVGYRVKSHRGILFRKWANNVLKEYLLKGYVVNEERTLVTNENYINLINKVDSIEKRVVLLENNDSKKLPIERVIFENTVFDSEVLINNLISIAKESIVLIDPYTDIRTLNALKGKRSQVKLIIYTSNKNRLSLENIESFNEDYGNLSINIDNQFHDRYLILDKKTFYHLGTSINYLGRKFSQISKVQDNDIKNVLLTRIDKFSD